MLLLGSKLIGTSIMGIQTGTKLAITKIPIVDPANLKIIAYEIDGPLLAERPAYLLIADVRELSSIGMIIDSSDEFVGIDDVIALKKVAEMNFRLVGLHVVDDTKKKLGKVTDYIVDTNSFVIQQLRVQQKILKSITNTELLIHRSQIIEINNTTIIVRSAIKKVESQEKVDKLVYVNPFRAASPAPQTNNTE